jgi:hypothetical protein
MHKTLAQVPLDSNHPDKLRLRKAAALVQALQKFPALQLAFGDFYTARREAGLYSAFYAFRVLEDVGFHFGVTKDDKPNWDTMNAALGTSKSKWQPLTDAGTWNRHLSERSLTKLETIDQAGLLRLAHEAVELTLKKIGLVE